MMKIGIITFHWAANYGAVLQAYALSSYLKSKGYSVEIINYRPQWAKDVKPIPFSFHIKSCITYLDELYKRKVFNKFRKKYLSVSEKEYVNISDLSLLDGCYDIIITGSDQVFNPDIIASGAKLDTTFLLDFTMQKGKKLAYAASFGNSFLADEYKNIFSEK